MSNSDDRDLKAAVRHAWSRGDYGRFAELVWPVGPVVVEAAGIGPGMRVLDVAAGTGNAAIRAAQAGAEVVASDLTPENFAAGRAAARAAGVELEWVEADAEALPFADASFDAVTSVFGAIFAPRHERVAAELSRVCRPGGVIAMANFTPTSLLPEFFGVFAQHMPEPRPGDRPPVSWGDETYVRDLFGDAISSLEVKRTSYVERAPTPAAYCEIFKETFGPVTAIYEDLAGQPDAIAELDRRFLEFAERNNRGEPGGPAEYSYEYLLVVARTADA